MCAEKKFTKENLNTYLKDFAKEYKKRYRGVPIELILVGGASVLLNYGFREMTTDIDAIVRARASVKDIINKIGDKYGLPNGWLNSDFTKTSSYSEKLIEHSEYYRTYSNIVSIRTVKAEYLIAMKLMSGRVYKKDLSDIIGILKEQKQQGKPISYDMVDTAVVELYGGWDKISKENHEFLQSALDKTDLDLFFNDVMKKEIASKSTLLEIQENYPNLINDKNINDILDKAKSKKSSLADQIKNAETLKTQSGQQKEKDMGFER